VGDRVDPIVGDQAQGGLQEQETARAPLAGVDVLHRDGLGGGGLGGHMYCTIVHELADLREQHGRRQADVVVIGGGIVGAATALALARRGAAVVLVEREPDPAARGSSKGGARIFCPAPYPDEAYLELGVRALERWRAIESQAGRELLVYTGALTTGRFVERAEAALRAAGQPAELLDADDVRRRFGVDTEGRSAIHQAEAGIIRADRAHAAVLELAAEAGTALHRGETAATIEPDSSGATVTTRSVRYRCETAVVAAGPWSRALLAPAGIELEASVTAQTVVYLNVDDAMPPPIALMDFDADEPYGLFDPHHGLKAALHGRGLEAGDTTRPPEADPTAAVEVERWARRAYPGSVGARTAVDACLYTRTPGERFVIERHGAVVVVSACNGQGFQFAPETGERAARIAVGATEASAA
jgi:sarcosine oxidase